MVYHTDIEEKVAIFVASNALVQFVAEFILEILRLVPTRVNHLSLTFLNAFLSYKTLSAISKDKFQFLHEDVQVLFALEILLIFGDAYYLISKGFDLYFFWVRFVFIILSTFNFVFVTYIISKYELYHITYQGIRRGRSSDDVGKVEVVHQQQETNLVEDDSGQDEENPDSGQDEEQ